MFILLPLVDQNFFVVNLSNRDRRIEVTLVCMARPSTFNANGGECNAVAHLL
jgi:hypothetical protein